MPDPGKSQPKDTPFRGRLETHDQYNQASRGAGQWEQVSGMDLDAGTGRTARASFKAKALAAEATGAEVLGEAGSSGEGGPREPPEAELWVPLTTCTRHWDPQRLHTSLGPSALAHVTGRRSLTASECHRECDKHLRADQSLA